MDLASCDAREVRHTDQFRRASTNRSPLVKFTVKCGGKYWTYHEMPIENHRNIP